jgi:hypothetical protein
MPGREHGGEEVHTFKPDVLKTEDVGLGDGSGDEEV